MSNATAPGISLELAARRFAALSDATRLRIVELLTSGEWCVCDLQEELDAAQSRLSFHLRKLKEAGLVNDRRVGRWAYYSLNADALEEMRGFLAAREVVDHRSGCGCGGCC
jgi:ArsR family transcriptional regulator, arsenate/arsenite/antimonite-responsive transcriptional repressor